MATRTKLKRRRERLKKFVNTDGCYEVAIAQRPDDDGWTGWEPESLDADSPDFFEFNSADGILDDVLLPALLRAHKYNADRLAAAASDDGTPRSWAIVVWHFNRAESDFAGITFSTPVKYLTIHTHVSPEWRPRHWLDCPASSLDSRFWDEFVHNSGSTLDDAATEAIEYNREYFKLRLQSAVCEYQQRRWHLVAAVEHEPRSASFDAFHFGPSGGTVSVTESRRFHIVTPDWPFAEKLNYKFTAKEAARFKRHFARKK